MFVNIRTLFTRVVARLPFPPIVILLVVIILSATPLNGLSALGAAGVTWHERQLLALVALVALHLLIVLLMPVRRLRVWQQLLVLTVQCAVVAAEQVVLPAPMLDYAYLAVVVQAIALFRPRVWISVTVAACLAWSATILFASASPLDWLQSNLALAFPVTCMIVAAVVYARQQSRHEHVQQLLQQLQWRYDALLLALRDAPQQAVIEERSRLAQTIAGEVSASLVNAERLVAEAITQAQANLGRIGAVVTQTQAVAAGAIDRLRLTVATLRQSEQGAGTLVASSTVLVSDGLLSLRSQRALSWALPLTFVGLAVPLVGLQHPGAPLLLWLGVLCCALLLVCYTLTQRIRSPLWVQAGLASQTLTVLGMALLTQTTPLLLGLLLVFWQIVTRLPGGQVALLVAGVHAPLSLLLLPFAASPAELLRSLLLLTVACTAMVVLLGTARRQVSRRKQAEERLGQLGQLTRELEQQELGLRALAVSAERSRLAREFHDDLGHQLMLIGVQLQLAEELTNEDPAAVLEQLIATREQLREAWRGVLIATDALEPLDGYLLAPALHTLVRRYQPAVGCMVSLRLDGDHYMLPAPIACAIYRAVQEGLSNACKHARASQVVVTVWCDSHEANARIENDGGATDTIVSAAPPSGFGLIGLRERAALLGGSLAVEPQLDGGFVLWVRVPLVGEAV